MPFFVLHLSPFTPCTTLVPPRQIIVMIDRFQRIASAIQILKIPSVAIGLVAFSLVAMTIFTSKSHESDHFLIPGIVCCLWAVNTYLFITIFRTIPAKADDSLRFFARLKRRLNRGWHWFVAIMFVATSLSALVVSYRMISIWLSDY